MAEYIEREEIKYEQWAVGPLNEPLLVVRKRTIDSIPAADVAPVRHGRWGKVYRSKVTVYDGYVSSCCDMWNERKSPYCPNCGAKMDLEG